MPIGGFIKESSTRRESGKEVTFAIRDAGDQLIGVVGADNVELGTTHLAEIGYWLARPYWGKGIMTAAVRAYVHYAFADLELLRLTAHVFEFNAGSAQCWKRTASSWKAV